MGDGKWSPMATTIGVGSGVCIWCQARHRQRQEESEFFHLLRLERHIGVSPSALQGVRVKLEGQILTYHQEQQQQLQQVPTKVEVCAGADETFFEQMVLVLLDLSSGYIFVEAQAKERGYQTWQALVQQALGPVVEVKYLVSDRAKALVKLALEGLGCRSVPDLFHALRDKGQARWGASGSSDVTVGATAFPSHC